MIFLFSLVFPPFCLLWVSFCSSFLCVFGWELRCLIEKVTFSNVAPSSPSVPGEAGKGNLGPPGAELPPGLRGPALGLLSLLSEPSYACGWSPSWGQSGTEAKEPADPVSAPSPPGWGPDGQPADERSQLCILEFAFQSTPRQTS